MSAVIRAGGASDAIIGVVPSSVVEPATLDEATEVVTACARDRRHLAFAGGGTELGLGATPERLDLLLRTTALGRIVEHAPLDQIVTAECGARIGDLQRALAAHGQRLSIDPPWADRATVGGIVASNAFGALRTRYGSIRDLIIGISFVRADGVRVRGGGKVVKNVAGFDLPKLLTGSLGTLGLIATATFRLHPLPETATTIVFPRIALADVQRLLRAAREAHLEPEAVAALSDAPGSARWRLGVRFAGFARGVTDQTARLRDVVAKLDGGLAIEADNDARFWDACESARAGDAAVRLKVAMLPADPNAADLLARLAEPLRDARAIVYPTLGLGFVSGGAGEPRAIAAATESVRRSLASSGGSVVVHEAPSPVRAELDVWGVGDGPRSAVPLMRNLKQRLDPERRLAPGRFVAGI
jgi:glycolate oxidase FAD binding subunit